VKYFLLGVLFLVVAGVIAYDRWNSAGEPQQDVAARPDLDTGDDVDMAVQPEPLKVEPATAPNSPQEPPRRAADPAATAPAVQRQPEVQPVPAEPTPAGAEPKVAPASSPGPDKTHVIKKGETLEAIAIQYYGTREGIQWIAEANRLGNANRIFANQKLIIPARKEIEKERGSGGAASEKSAAKVPSRYRVKEGDGNLYAICRRLYGREGQGARVARIMEMNHLWSAEVKPGTLLILPPR
jgi:nucleoid-associated protein YgaU